jgi:hypothetical protein
VLFSAAAVVLLRLIFPSLRRFFVSRNLVTFEKVKAVLLVLYYAAWFAFFLFVGYLAFEAMKLGL